MRPQPPRGFVCGAAVVVVCLAVMLLGVPTLPPVRAAGLRGIDRAAVETSTATTPSAAPLPTNIQPSGRTPTTPRSRRNVVFMLVDDWGYADVGVHGSDLPTPAIDGFCSAGTRLSRYYVQPICTPTRASLLTGRHVIHTGQYVPLGFPSATRLNLSYTLMPEYFKRLGYDTHMIGKWHLGGSQARETPTRRGFDSWLGFLSGVQDYYTHESGSFPTGGGAAWAPEVRGGYDFWEGTTPALEHNMTFGPYTLTARAVELIRRYAAAADPAPFFMYIAHQLTHDPWAAPAGYGEGCDRVAAVGTPRWTYCAMVRVLDESVRNVTDALGAGGLVENTLVVLSSDNGGLPGLVVPGKGIVTTDFPQRNHPLRGGKGTLFEGGVRVLGCLRGPDVPKGAVWDGYFHVTDWLFTLIDAVGGWEVLLDTRATERAGASRHAHTEPRAPGTDVETIAPATPPAGIPFEQADGLSQWAALRGRTQPPRTWVLHEAHSSFGHAMHAGTAYTSGDMKLLRAEVANFWFNPVWVPVDGRAAPADDVAFCGSERPGKITMCVHTWCLFNITADPCEHHDLAALRPDDVARLVAEVEGYMLSAAPQAGPGECRAGLDARGVVQLCTP